MEGLCKNSISLALLLFCLLGLICAQDSPDDYVKAHNAARAEVGVATGGCELKHSGIGLGQNIAVSPDGNLSAAMAVEGWVREKVDYDYSTNACAPGKQCGHYTQVVWRDSGLVRCGKAECADGSSYVVCHYDPAGNSAGEKPY
ncbi:pathogenesis-related leaf protein 4-like [Pyrus ussuriensis x Pyrus communis]|uniref:Pathogenesis-related leaf protein 4-like n=1 Tax=Pyrus ussuriensis x Pyrus communis TaxID=2448454 RepID=A0A5N5FHL5_9ROSA|nr:pathogenesis-related leaf protein 4-like [Pyrus ussuriensis x Pyrus communis]